MHPPENARAALAGGPTLELNATSSSHHASERASRDGQILQAENDLERIVLGGLLCYGLDAFAGIDIRPSDFQVPARAEAWGWLCRYAGERWFPGSGNELAHQASLTQAGLADKLGPPNAAAYDLVGAAKDLPSLGVAHYAGDFLLASVERQRREAMARATDGRISGDEFVRINRELDARVAAFNLGGKFEPPQARPLIEFLDTQPDESNTLLGDRFLCREGGMLFVGPSGIGKSSASVQMDVCWSIGRDAFGIKTPRPLRILQIQAENDDDDIREMTHGVVDAMCLTVGEREMCRVNLLVIGEKARTAQRFIEEVLAPALAKHKPDIVRIDPLLAYLGADPTDTAKLSQFCRNWLNPLLEQYQCGSILNHHTPKTTNRDTTNWRASDWMYSGAGGAEITNWARAILVVEPTSNPSAFKFIAAKRGRRVGWSDQFGQPVFQRVFCHSEGSIAWREATEEEAEGVRPRGDKGQPTDEELIAHVPAIGTVAKDVLLAKWNKLGMGQKKCAGILNVFLDDEILFEHLEKRPGTRAKVLISRQEQTLL